MYPYIFFKIHFSHRSSLKLPNFIFRHFNLPNPTILIELNIHWPNHTYGDRYEFNFRLHFTLDRTTVIQIVTVDLPPSSRDSVLDSFYLAPIGQPTPHSVCPATPGPYHRNSAEASIGTSQPVQE